MLDHEVVLLPLPGEQQVRGGQARHDVPLGARGCTCALASYPRAVWMLPPGVAATLWRIVVVVGGEVQVIVVVVVVKGGAGPSSSRVPPSHHVMTVLWRDHMTESTTRGRCRGRRWLRLGSSGAATCTDGTKARPRRLDRWSR